MKTAKQWRIKISGHGHDAGYYSDKEVEQIQLDAFNAGLKSAIPIGKKLKKHVRSTDYKMAIGDFTANIVRAIASPETGERKFEFIQPKP